MLLLRVGSHVLALPAEFVLPFPRCVRVTFVRCGDRLGSFPPLSWDLAVALYFCYFDMPLFRVVCGAFALLSFFLLALATASRLRVLRALPDRVFC